jgi:tyrosyl-tRNA synthetase
MKTYIEQLGLILDMKKVEIHYNSEWLDAMSAGDLIRAAMNFTVNQMIKRDNFFQRFEADKPIGLHEIMYPLLQGYDSVAIKASIEIGGNDQLFNLLAGRTLQKKYGQKEQNVMTFDLLMGTDGRKMSTSYGNCIYIQDEPNEMFGKIMSIRDDLIIQYMTLVTDMKTSEIEKIEKELLSGMNPRDAKIILGKALVSRYYDDKKADDAAENFANVFKNNEMPEEIREFKVLDKEWRIVDLMHFIGLVPSKTEARRMIDQGGVRIDGAVIGDREAQIRPTDKMIIQIGKRKFVRIKLDK